MSAFFPSRVLSSDSCHVPFVGPTCQYTLIYMTKRYTCDVTGRRRP